MHTRGFRGVVVAVLAAVVLVSAAGCSSTSTPEPSRSGAPVITPTELPDAAPEFVADGTADENRAYFDYVVSRHVVDEGTLGRDGVIAVLTGAGWPVDAIEATADATPLGNAADAITFSVRMGPDCLVGHWNGEYSSVIANALASGTCLVGTPHPAG